MRISARTATVISSTLVLAALLVLAAGLSGMPLREGGDLNLLAYLLGRIELPQPALRTTGARVDPGTVNVLRILVWILLPLTLVYALISPQYRRTLLRTLFLIGAFILIAGRLRPLLTQQERPETELGAGALGASNQLLPPTPDFVTDTPEWLVWSVDVLLVFAVVLAVWLVWRRLRPAPVDLQSQLIESADSALAQLDAGGERVRRRLALLCGDDETPDQSQPRPAPSGNDTA